MRAGPDQHIEDVEEWARAASFSRPVRLGEVEAGVLSRQPLKQDMPWWVHLVGAIGVASLGFAIAFGAGAPVTGTIFIWLGTRGPSYSDGWLLAANLLFWITALVQVSALIEQRTEKGLRDATTAVMQVLTVAGCASAYALMRSLEDKEELSGWLVLGVVVAGLLSSLVLVVATIGAVWSAFHPAPNAHRKAVRRGPKRFNEHQDYVNTREQVLDILTERGLVSFDETDRIRLRGMPLGYWEELDGVDEREWRRILEYRSAGWRTFTEADRRPWPPG